MLPSFFPCVLIPWEQEKALWSRDVFVFFFEAIAALYTQKHKNK